jgi:hypothetical protein
MNKDSPPPSGQPHLPLNPFPGHTGIPVHNSVQDVFEGDVEKIDSEMEDIVERNFGKKSVPCPKAIPRKAY